MLIPIGSDNTIIKYPALENIYPIINEISLYYNSISSLSNDDEKVILDDYYGRMFSESVYDNVCPYGITSIMPYYDCMGKNSYEIIGYFRVPYRKVPIYKAESNTQAKEIIEKVKIYNKNSRILIRGQEKQYTINREEEEKRRLFGDEKLEEPSFLSSHTRLGINENLLRCLWNWQGRILLNDIGIDLKSILSPTEYDQYYKSKVDMEGSDFLSSFSLGIAQHYGLPSVGLDLTDKYEVALTFASTHYELDSDHNLKVSKIDNFDEAMIYVFSCPENVVFDYRVVKPCFFPESRPDRQNAWFGHVGWGFAKNQMAMYLSCCIKVSSEMSDIVDSNYIDYLFPSKEKDMILNHFISLKDGFSYEKEVQDVMNRIYEVIK